MKWMMSTVLIALAVSIGSARREPAELESLSDRQDPALIDDCVDGDESGSEVAFDEVEAVSVIGAVSDFSAMWPGVPQ